MKIKIPDEVAFVGFSDEPAAAVIEPGLTTLAQPMNEIGKVAVSILFEHMGLTFEEVQPITKVLKTQLIVRGSSLKNLRSTVR